LLIIETVGSKEMGDAIWNEFFHPVALRLISKCDVVLRIGGPSSGADEMIWIGKEQRKRIAFSLKEIG